MPPKSKSVSNKQAVSLGFEAKLWLTADKLPPKSNTNFAWVQHFTNLAHKRRHLL